MNDDDLKKKVGQVLVNFRNAVDKDLGSYRMGFASLCIVSTGLLFANSRFFRIVRNTQHVPTSWISDQAVLPIMLKSNETNTLNVIHVPYWRYPHNDTLPVQLFGIAVQEPAPSFFKNLEEKSMQLKLVGKEDDILIGTIYYRKVNSKQTLHIFQFL